MENKSYKEQIMLALSNISSNELSHEAYIWAASNLPDSNSTGTQRVPPANKPYDHASSSILQACGFPNKEDAQKVLDEIDLVKENLPKNSDGTSRISIVIEKVLTDYYATGDDRIMRFITAMFFMAPSTMGDPISLLLRLLGGKRD